MSMLLSKEHYALMDQFEKNFRHMRLDREKDKTMWSKGCIYEHGEANELFKAYRQGYALGKSEATQ